MNAHPDKDSVQVGDTLFFELKASTVLKDLNSSNEINFSNAENLGTVIRFFEFIDDKESKGAVNDFKTILYIGNNVSNQIDPSSMLEYLFSEANDAYVFKLGVVPQKKR